MIPKYSSYPRLSSYRLLEQLNSAEKRYSELLRQILTEKSTQNSQLEQRVAMSNARRSRNVASAEWWSNKSSTNNSNSSTPTATANTSGPEVRFLLLWELGRAFE